jgi:tape measure domain-containing protein
VANKQYKLDILINAIDRFTAPFDRMQRRLDASAARGPVRIANALGRLGTATGVPRISDALGTVKDRVDDVGSAATKTARRIAYLGTAGAGVAYLFKREFLGTASTFENLRMSLESIEGSADGASRAMGFVKDLTLKTPFEMEDIAKTFRMMRGFGMDPTNGSLQAIIDQTAKIGGTGDQLQHIALQLGQAFSKGRLQAQDANILVENGIPIWGILQRAVERTNKGQKITVAQLRQMSEAGQLGLPVIKLLLQQIGIESAGAALKANNTWTGMVSNLSDQWTFFKQRVMETGAFDRVKRSLAGILQRIDVMSADGRLQRWADRIGGSLERAFTWLDSNGPRILEDLGTNLGRVFDVADKIATTVGGWNNLVKFGLAAYIGGPLVTSVIRLVGAVGSLNIALAGTPAGLLLLGGAALIGGAAYLTFSNLDAARSRMGGSTTGDFVPGLEPGGQSNLLVNPGTLNGQDVPTTDARVLAMRKRLDAVTHGAAAKPSGAPLLDPSRSAARAGALGRLQQRFGSVGVEPQTARVQIDINGPKGTRASVDPNSTADIDLRQRVNMGQALAVGY